MKMYEQNPQFQAAAKICQTLEAHGHQAWLAGGCVRDFLLQRVPNDFDIATSAKPDQIEALFPRTVAVGKNFGVIVVVDDQIQTEVATFRLDGLYQDGRRPEGVVFASPEEDALRRDFTVNAMFYDLKKDEVVDFVGGIEDLKQGQLKAVGDPLLRFEEDHLRLLRCVRLSAQLEFEIEEKTWAAVVQQAKSVQTVSGERIQEELSKLLMAGNSGGFQAKVFERLFRSGILSALVKHDGLCWIPAESFFVRRVLLKEDLWFRFFLWIQQLATASGGLSLWFFESLCEQWKFSRELKQKVLKSLHWMFEDDSLAQHSLGELIELSYDPDQMRGLVEYAEHLSKKPEQDLWRQMLERRKHLGAFRPGPLVQARDLMDRGVRGENLGKALKWCYHRQLEGLANSASELLLRWQELK